jgi:hypothetical protein
MPTIPGPGGTSPPSEPVPGGAVSQDGGPFGGNPAGGPPGVPGPPGGVSAFPYGRSASFPAKVTLQFPSYDCAQPAGGCRDAWARSVLARCEGQGDAPDPPFDVSDAACLGYGDYGFAGEARVFDTARAYWKPIGDDGEEIKPAPTEPANVADLKKLAYAVARDFYGWRKFAFDVKHEGLMPAIPNGYLDEAIWTATGDEWSTRMLSAPPDDRTEQMNHAFAPPTNCTCCDGGCCDKGGCPSCSTSTVHHAKTGSRIPARSDEAYSAPRMGKGTVRLYRSNSAGDLIQCGYAYAYNQFSQEISSNAWIQLGVSCGKYVVISEDCPNPDA